MLTVLGEMTEDSRINPVESIRERMRGLGLRHQVFDPRQTADDIRVTIEQNASLDPLLAARPPQDPTSFDPTWHRRTDLDLDSDDQAQGALTAHRAASQLDSRNAISSTANATPAARGLATKMSHLSVTAMGESLRAGTITSQQLTEASLGAAEAVNELGAFVLVDRDGALGAAAKADAAIAAGRDLGPLMGIPVGVKDIVDMAGLPTRCGSPAYANSPTAADASFVTRLRSSGAVIVGKTTTHELACGVYSPPAKNPWNPDYVPGGSSGGSAVAIASRVVPVAIGSDTGGSIRIPAALCGTVGLKPTYGRVSRSGVAALSWSLDHLGPLGATVACCAKALEALAGPDFAPDGDTSTATVPVPRYSAVLDRGIAGLRIGVLTGAPLDPVQPAVTEVFAKATDLLAQEGATMVSVEVPELQHCLAAEFGIVGPEAAAYHRELLRRAGDWIDPVIRTLLVVGLMIDGECYFKALQARKIIAAALRTAFSEHRLDAMITPTLPATATPIGVDDCEFPEGPEAAAVAYVRTTAPFNLSGQPALSVPAGYDESLLPIGLQIATRPFDEAMALRIGAAFEARADVADDRPQVQARSPLWG